MAISLTTNPLPMASNRSPLNCSFHNISAARIEVHSILLRARDVRTSARRSSGKKAEKKRELRDLVGEDDENSSHDEADEPKTITAPSRRLVLTSCSITSSVIAALGIVIRQASHVGALNGLPIPDCTANTSFGFHALEAELVAASVILITTCRFLLLRNWPDFAESSETANRQVLSSLELQDYVVVSFLPGISEELLFRGALQPVIGMTWESALLVAALFGVLHLGGGRRTPYAIWSTFVGVVYGGATLYSSSIIVPMASHALNNLAGGLLWRFTSKSLDNQP